MLITSCGCDIVAGETTDPTNALGDGQARQGRAGQGRFSAQNRMKGRMAAAGEFVLLAYA